MLGWPEIIAIAAVAALVFGGSRLAAVGRGLGEGLRGFADGVRGAFREED